MKNKLKSLMGKPNVWLYLGSCNTWFREAKILEVTEDLVTFRFSTITNEISSFWERTTRIENITDIDIEISNVPVCEGHLKKLKDKLSEMVGESKDFPHEPSTHQMDWRLSGIPSADS